MSKYMVSIWEMTYLDVMSLLPQCDGRSQTANTSTRDQDSKTTMSRFGWTDAAHSKELGNDARGEECCARGEDQTKASLPISLEL